MPVQFETIIPWGRSFQEYKEIFNLSEADLSRTILGCGDGPASFNAEMKAKGKTVVSVDPIYEFSKSQIEERIKVTYQSVKRQVETNLNDYNWDKIKNVDSLLNMRMNTMQKFMADYEAGLSEKRYVTAELPVLPFADLQFELCLCSHLLFLYTDQLSVDFHTQSVIEMMRVAKEVRIFPIVDQNSAKSKHLDKVLEIVLANNFKYALKKSAYEFQKNAKEMLIISRKS